MHDAFICHSEADETIAIKVALALEEAGYSTWYYERDNVPGESYLIQVGRAIEESRALIFIASPNSITSGQVTAEVVRAYESRIPCVPLLLGITHRELGKRQQTLRQALVTATSIAIPEEGIAPILPRVLRGLENLDIKGQGRVPPELVSETRRILTAISARGATSPRPDTVIPPPPPKRMHMLLPGLAVMLGVLGLLIVLALVHPWRSDTQQTAQGPAGGPFARSVGNVPPGPLNEPSESPTRTTPMKTCADSSKMGTQASAQTAGSVVGSAASRPAQPPEAVRQEAPTPDDHRMLLALIDDDSGVARDRLLQAMSSRTISFVDPARVAETRSSVEAARALEGSDASCQELGSRLHADFVLIGKAITISVPNDYGLKSVRAELSLRLIDAATGRRVSSWTQKKTAVHLSQEVAERMALEQVAEATADSVAQRMPRP